MGLFLTGHSRPTLRKTALQSSENMTRTRSIYLCVSGICSSNPAYWSSSTTPPPLPPPKNLPHNPPSSYSLYLLTPLPHTPPLHFYKMLAYWVWRETRMTTNGKIRHVVTIHSPIRKWSSFYSCDHSFWKTPSEENRRESQKMAPLSDSRSSSILLSFFLIKLLHGSTNILKNPQESQTINRYRNIPYSMLKKRKKIR